MCGTQEGGCEGRQTRRRNAKVKGVSPKLVHTRIPRKSDCVWAPSNAGTKPSRLLGKPSHDVASESGRQSLKRGAGSRRRQGQAVGPACEADTGHLCGAGGHGNCGVRIKPRCQLQRGRVRASRVMGQSKTSGLKARCGRGPRVTLSLLPSSTLGWRWGGQAGSRWCNGGDARARGRLERSMCRYVGVGDIRANTRVCMRVCMCVHMHVCMELMYMDTHRYI